MTGREGEWAELPPANPKRKIVVVGGGPAGAEAARVAAERGHEVVLFERARRLGGQVNLAMRTPQRGSFEEIISFFERQLAKLGVDVRLGVDADVDTVLAESPDAVVVATGSTAFRPDVIGAQASNVLSARDVIAGGNDIGERVLVVDTHGRAEGITVAEHLADMGCQVEVITGLAYVGCEMPAPAWHKHAEGLLQRGVVLTPFTGVWEIEAAFGGSLQRHLLATAHHRQHRHRGVRLRRRGRRRPLPCPRRQGRRTALHRRRLPGPRHRGRLRGRPPHRPNPMMRRPSLENYLIHRRYPHRQERSLHALIRR